ncbi:hypothetical protein KAR91_18240 [Candidatus Pacearchaeota archaeon]|nr:hypothetical protein [Candidatus Pacearchaeota archaeon]
MAKKTKDDSGVTSDPIEDLLKEQKEDALCLSEEEKLKIQAVVDKELAATAKQRLCADYKAGLIAEALKKKLFKDAKPGKTGDGLVPIFVNLPQTSNCVRIDGTAFYSDRTYNVLPGVRALILEMMGRGEDHEDSINGKTAAENRFRRKGTQGVTL